MHPERRARYWKRFEHRYAVEDALPPKYNTLPLQDPPGTSLKQFAQGIPLFQDSDKFDMKQSVGSSSKGQGQKRKRGFKTSITNNVNNKLSKENNGGAKDQQG